MRCLFFCFKQKTAYEMRISDWSSDVCSSDLVRGLAQGVLQRVVPRERVGADLALRHHAAQVRMHVFDRVFDRDDMAARILVAVAEHRRKRRRLAGAGRDDHQERKRKRLKPRLSSLTRYPAYERKKKRMTQ